MMQQRAIAIVFLLATTINGASSTDAPTSLRGTNRRVVKTSPTVEDGTNDDGIVSALSKQFLHIAVGAIDHMYRRSLQNEPISPTKVRKVLDEGLSCVYGESTAAQKSSNQKDRQLQNSQLGRCLTKVLGSNRVIKRRAIVQKAFQLAAEPLNARPDHVLPMKKANKIVTIISLIAELAENHAEFKKSVLLYINAEIESGDIMMDQEALHGLDLFLTVANLGDE